MSYQRKNKQTTTYGLPFSPVFCIVISVLAVLVGIFFIIYHANTIPVPREDTVEYSGLFHSVDTWKDTGTIELSNGASFTVHRASDNLLQALEDLTPGTPIRLLVDQRSDAVMEITTEAGELLSYQTMKKSLMFDSVAFIVLGSILIFGGIFIPFYLLIAKKAKEKEDIRESIATTAGDSIPLRHADMDIKCRILAETTAKTDGWIYRICYRRVKHTNELVVNGEVYDEKKGVLEFSHTLYARLNGDLIEAGFDDSTQQPSSFIRFNGEELVRKTRII